MKFIKRKTIKNDNRSYHTIKRDVPLTSEHQLETELNRRNRLNRDRAKTMERRVAKFLKGSRVPMSGALANYKGDVVIPFVNNPGGYLIECKLSAQAPKHIPQLRLMFEWFTKIDRESRVMPGMKFGIVIIHYHDTAEDYVFISEQLLTLLVQKYTTRYALELQELWSKSNILDCSLSNRMKPTGSFNLRKHVIDDAMISIAGLKGVRVKLPNDDYLVITLVSFRTIMEGL